MSIAVAVSSIVTADPSNGTDITQNEVIVEGTLTLSANYGGASTHGDTVNFATATSPAGTTPIQSSLAPRRVEVFENQGAGNAPLGYTYIYNNGTDQTNGVLTILGTPAVGAATTGATEFTQGAAYSGGTPSLLAAVLRFKAWFPRFL